ncbi:GNAT family N-acetyltransferase [Sulfitobacter sp. S223]|uniref:GNAT family N-acetyltransferase n=1 Tax=Sulfitobacter sp. S223 TaxID=2867023 RepID=UPI0021A520FF|nr:GNAT family N-acetyltransferase [Sulfitobacter sp. S223]UWR25219.1 GNAT family N-acetyltransferase [Sulfitobacter sp. S223]
MRIVILPAPTPAFEHLVDTHTVFCDSTAPAESCHRLPVSALFGPDLTVWGAYERDELIGMGALKRLSAHHGEIKSMHTRATARGKGVARAIIQTIVTAGREEGLKTLSLETGAHPAFSAARGLYAAHGFTECDPFGDYVTDPHSIFMTMTLEADQ